MKPIPTPPVEPQLPSQPEGSLWRSLWEKLVWIGKAALRWLLGPGAALVVVVVAIVLVAIGVKNVQVGGVLGKLFGKKNPEKKAIDVANSVPEDRVDAKGKLIPQGKPDSKGMTQAVVVPIKDPGVFSNPDTVVFQPPDEPKPVEIQLPVGVKARDVDKVVVVKPEKFVITVKSESKVPAKSVDDLLAKYGG